MRLVLVPLLVIIMLVPYDLSYDYKPVSVSNPSGEPFYPDFNDLGALMLYCLIIYLDLSLLSSSYPAAFSFFWMLGLMMILISLF